MNKLQSYKEKSKLIVLPATGTSGSKTGKNLAITLPIVATILATTAIGFGLWRKRKNSSKAILVTNTVIVHYR